MAQPWWRSLAGLMLLAVGPAVSSAQAGEEDVFGVWRRSATGAEIEIKRCAERLCGKVVRLPDSSQRDLLNSDPRLRTRPLIGAPLFSSMSVSQGAWRGSLYLPEEGKRYRVKIFVQDQNQLAVRSCAFLHLFCSTEFWTRVK